MYFSKYKIDIYYRNFNVFVIGWNEIKVKDISDWRGSESFRK